MERLKIVPRPGWRAKVEKLGLLFHTGEEQPYWDESVCYRFTATEIDVLEAATNELHARCLEAVQGGNRPGSLRPLWHPGALRTLDPRLVGAGGSLALRAL